MPFHFKKSESPAKTVRRVCRERIGAALAHLRQSDRPAAVHGVRKEIKKVRAIFRLVRGEIGRGVYRKGTKALRAAAGSLTATRDARAKLKAFEKLTGRSAGRFPEIEKALRKYYRREARRFQKSDSGVLADRILRKTNRRVGDLKITAAGWGVIEPGLRQSYRRGWSAHRLARREPSSENFHEWRKHVKDLWCYLHLLQPAWPSKIRAMMDKLELLGEQLGDDHDLVLLKDFVGGHLMRAGDVDRLNQLIDSRQKKLRAVAFKLGARFFAGRPSAFCRPFEKYWKVWRRKP